MSTLITDFVPAGRGPFAIKLAKPQAGMRLLNVGCFNGALERHFLEPLGVEAYGVDLNADAVAFAQQQARDPSRFSVSPAEKLPFENGHFDIVFLLDVLEHVEDESRTLTEIYRVLKPGGRLVVSVPHDFLNFLDPDDLTRTARNFVRRYIRKRPLLTHPKHRHYGEAALRGLLRDFSIETVHRSGTPVFWLLAMFYNALAIPPKLLDPVRKLTNPIENAEYALRLPNGFNIMVTAVKPAVSAVQN